MNFRTLSGFADALAIGPQRPATGSTERLADPTLVGPECWLRKRVAVGTCKLCGQQAKLVDAHIIPEAFFRDLQTPGASPLQIVSNDSAMYPERSHIGVYDKNIVCKDCELKFVPWDSYAARLLIQGSSTSFQSLEIGGVTSDAASVATDINYKSL